MIFRLLSTTIFLLLMNYLSMAQSFQTIYFEYEDFPFIDEMKHADFNNDGIQDFLIAASNGGRLQVGISSGISAPVFSEITNITSIQKTAIIDIDSDGDFDIIGLRQFTGAFVFINDGNAFFETQQLNLSTYQSLAFEDVTGNGSLELIVASFDLAIYEINLTTWNLTEIYSEDFGNGDIGAVTKIDFDQDGDMDLIISTESDGLFLLNQTTPMVFESSILYADSYDVDDIILANLSNDDIPDFVLYSSDDSRAKIVVSDINGQYIEEELSEEDVNNTLTLVGDLNKDEIAEIITFENTSFNDFEMNIKEYSDGLKNLDRVVDHFATFGGGMVDLNNDGNRDFYFFQNDITRPGVIFYLSDGFSSIQNTGNMVITIFPNPASDIINIEVENGISYKFSLYGLQGNLLKSGINANKIIVGELSSGMYFLELEDLKSGEKLMQKIYIDK